MALRPCDCFAFAGFSPATRTGLVTMVSAPPPRRRLLVQAAYGTLRVPVADQRAS
ncbi:hypothetical protein ACIGXM_02745 [Kitasatospora sp. NPDC052896]|uniref:hypothetical protein n=1 Tax=Kitasatospora sp. NPDC052896 TaxID=3364061 RepID=UPI0037CB9A5B